NLDLGRLDSAYFYYTLSEEINTRTDNKYLLSLNYQGMSAYYSKLYEQTWDKHNLTESNNYALKLVELALELNNAERLLQGYEKVWKATQKLGDYKTALNYHIKHTDLKDSLFAKEKADQII